MFEELARLYDRLTEDFDYGKWCEIYLNLLRKSGVDPKTVCDAGCGTGRMCVELARRGLQVTGMDRSEDMLRVASERARHEGVRVPLARQDLRNLALHRPVDAVFCVCDGVNYLCGRGDTQAFFRRAYAALRPGGALAFDISGAEKLRAMDGGVYFEDREDCTYLWRNEAEGDVLRMELTFFVPEDDGRYARFDEAHRQRIFQPDALCAELRATGFGDIRVEAFDDPHCDAFLRGRLHFVAVRP